MVSRDPSDYHPTVHCTQRSRERGISYEQIATTIQDGRIEPSPQDNCKLFVKEFDQELNPVGVVADIQANKIITVEYRY
jgi:hypothetical protein